MKRLLVVAGVGAVGLVLLLLILRIVGLDPNQRRPGLWLRGEVVTTPMNDWSSIPPNALMAIQTREWRFPLLPLSVTTVYRSVNHKDVRALELPRGRCVSRGPALEHERRPRSTRPHQDRRASVRSGLCPHYRPCRSGSAHAVVCLPAGTNLGCPACMSSSASIRATSPLRTEGLAHRDAQRRSEVSARTEKTHSRALPETATTRRCGVRRGSRDSDGCAIPAAQSSLPASGSCWLSSERRHSPSGSASWKAPACPRDSHRPISRTAPSPHAR